MEWRQWTCRTSFGAQQPSCTNNGVQSNAAMVIIICVISTAALCFIAAWYLTGRKRAPGPRGLPILGHLHLLGNNPHRSLFDLSKVHGPLMWLRFGSVPVIVASTPAAARLILQTNDRIFAGRPRPVVAVSVVYGCRDITFSPPNSEWKLMKQICVTDLVSNKRLEAFKPVREMEARILVASVMREVSEGSLLMDGSDKIDADGRANRSSKEEAAGGMMAGTDSVQGLSARSGIIIPEASASPVMVSIRTKLLQANNNTICRMLFGKTLSDMVCCDGESACTADPSLNLLELLDELNHCLSIFNLGDLIPSIAWMDLQGVRRRSDRVARKMDIVLQGILDSRRRCSQLTSKIDAESAVRREEDLLDVLLSISAKNDQITDDNIKGFILDMFVGGTDTSAYTAEWVMAELLANPAEMEAVQDEIDNVVGRERVVGEADLTRLPYLRAVVSEAMRLHPIVPFLIPHVATQSCELMGYGVPASAQAYVNVWAVGRDAETWEEPQAFKPERFLDGRRVSVGVQSFELLPFGAGRRGCPGWVLGLLNVHLQVASLLQAFHWSAPPGFDLDDKFGMMTIKAQPLAASAAPKLPLHLYLHARA